jgi:hypothetical protein
MTLFAYVAIAFSLVFSFSAMRLLSGLPYAIRPSSRYWVHLSFVLIHLLGTSLSFWIFWALRDADWTLPKFLLALASPGAVFFISCSLVPENPSAVMSWRDHYFAARRSFFLGLIPWALVSVGVATFVAGLPWLHPGRFGQTLLLLVGAVGVSSASPRVHAALVIAVLVAIAAAASTVYLQPGSIAQ